MPSPQKCSRQSFTFPGHEGKGIATAMATELVNLAVRHEPAVSVTAQTLPEHNASHRILEKLGFCHADTLDHPDEGTVWEWHLVTGRASEQQR